MVKRPVVIYPNAVLSAQAEPVREIGAEELALIRDMIETMFASGGVGIAAPQVGVSKRIFIACPSAERGGERVFVNPVVIKSWGREMNSEGCLSLPKITAEIPRATGIEYEALDQNGKKFGGRAEGFLAKVIQHELDHLNGKLIVDRADFDQRQTLLNLYQRALREAE